MQLSPSDMMAQRAFRRLLLAMSQPGRVCELPHPAATGRKPWEAILLILESLLDQEVSAAVIGAGQSRELESLVAGRTRCRTADAGQADFLIVADGDSRGEILRAKRGTPQYPDTSATAVFGVWSLLVPEKQPPIAALTGPGIRGEALLSPIAGLGPHELEHLRVVNGDFPLGVDAIFSDPAGRILCIPRSTNIRIVGH